MSPIDAYLQLITPVAVLLAVTSGITFGLLIRWLRPSVDVHITTYLCIVIGVLWYIPQAVSLFAVGGTPWATLGRMTLYLLGFVVPMWIVLRWKR